MDTVRDRIISEIKCMVADGGIVPGVRAFEQATGIHRREWTGKFWARWGDAIKEAGFEPNPLVGRMDSDRILEFIAACCLGIGRWAAPNDLRLNARTIDGFPSNTTIENHFPKRSLLVEAMRDWAARPENAAFSDVLTMLPAKKAVQISEAKQTSMGHVYLLKSGFHYKIGQSSDLERRVKSVSVALPEKVVLEHSTMTDDPSGIEAYWHQRFADRRLNGEWFKLTHADVLVFKKRKFQ